jgi:signal transduction histidine kinase
VNIENDVITTINETLKPWSSKNLHFQIHVDKDVHFSAPIDGFTYTLSQLVDNACKFAKPDGQVAISLQKENDQAVLTIENDGTRIPNSLQDKVFERFFQVSSGDARESSGLGLGLAITRNFVDSCGGAVEFLDSKSGTKICMRLPVIVEAKMKEFSNILEMVL